MAYVATCGGGAAYNRTFDGTATTMQDMIWGNWVNIHFSSQDTTATTTYVSNSTTAATIWVSWVGEHNQAMSARTLREANAALAEHRRRSEQASAARMEEIRKAEEVKRQQQLRANEVARQLLLENLTPAQKETFERTGLIVVEGGKSKEEYHIATDGIHGNVYQLDKDKKVYSARYCFQIADYAIPLYDHILAQKLALEYDEERALKIANRTNVMAPNRLAA